MWLLARFKIITKIIVVISLLAATAVAIGWFGVHAMASLNADADNMSFAAQRDLAAARANQSVIALNRSEFRIALDPSPENQLAVRTLIEERMKSRVA
jgi:methyl-accepting chemotaxis protein